MAKAKSAPKQVSKKGNELTSPKMAKLASEAMRDPKASEREKSIAAALLNQTADKKKSTGK